MSLTHLDIYDLVYVFLSERVLNLTWADHNSCFQYGFSSVGGDVDNNIIVQKKYK